MILYRFAVAAVSTGLFSLSEAAWTFVLIAVGEIAYGIGLGWFSLRLRRWVQDPHVEITLSLLTPYAAFLVAEQLGGSGVLATVAAGLSVSWNGPLLIPAAKRLQEIFFCDLLIYLLEGLVFLVTGMQLSTLLDRVDAVLLRDLGFTPLLTVAVVIVIRFIWVYPTVHLPRWLSPSLARRDPLLPPQWDFFLGLVGVRGVVSLAAALAIPLTTAAGMAFPDRDLIIFVALGVIVVTFVGEGLMLPPIVRWLGLNKHAAREREREHKAEVAARAAALKEAQVQLKELAAEGGMPPEALAILRARHEFRSGRLSRTAADGSNAALLAAEARMALITVEREYIYRLLQEGQITDEARRRIERELDLEERSIHCKKEGGKEPQL